MQGTKSILFHSNTPLKFQTPNLSIENLMEELVLVVTKKNMNEWWFK